MPASNHRNPAALRLYFGQQRRLFLRRPLPPALNDNLAIYSKELLPDCPEGVSFPQCDRPDHDHQVGSDRTLTAKAEKSASRNVVRS